MIPADQARLARILKIARELELAWPSRDRRQILDFSADRRLQELKREIADCAQSETPSLQRLAAGSLHLHDQISLAHFYGCIVPFERLSGRALRDDEFLVEEGDRFENSVQRVPLKLITENLRSAFNVGALFRTCECLGVSEIILTGYTPGPEDEKTRRTSMGTSTVVPWRRLDRAPEACEELRREGYMIVALETAATATSLYDFDFNGKPVALIVGNERFGLDGETLSHADAICRIPLRGIKNSMNAGVAFGIAGFEWLRQFEESAR
jgi:23S rRNA (guanosine2251-2'-O)-methyltransferase